MDNNQFTPEVETPVEAAPVVEEPRAKAIVSMVLGILSILNAGIVGLILAIIAKKFCMPILADFAETASAKFANVAKITSKIGLILSIITIIGFAIYFGILILIAIAGVLSEM